MPRDDLYVDMDPQKVRQIKAEAYVDLGEMDEREWKAEMLAASRISYIVHSENRNRIKVLEWKVNGMLFALGGLSGLFGLLHYASL
jgi:hypothetical protein